MHTRLLYLFLFFTHIVFSQNCNILLQGNAIDNIHSESEMHFSVRLYNDKNEYHTHTDNLGNFEFSTICEGMYELELTNNLNEKFIFIWNVSTNETKKFELSKAIHELHKVEISIPHKGTIFEKTSIENEIALNEIAEKTSGFSILSSGNAIQKPIINGLYSNRIITMQQGVRIEDQQWGIEHGLSIDLQSNDFLKVIKDANTLEYSAENIGGILLFETRNLPKKDTLEGNVKSLFQSNGKNFGLNTQIIKGFNAKNAIKVNASYSITGDYQSPSYPLTNTGSRIFHFSTLYQFNLFDWKNEFSYNINKSTIGILKSSHIGSMRDLYYAIENNEPFYIDDFSYQINAPKQEVMHQIVTFSSKKSFDTFDISWQYAFQNNNRQEFDIRRNNSNEIPSLHFHLTTQSLDFKLNKNYSWFKLTSGFAVNFQQNSSDEDVYSKPLIPNYAKFNSGFFAILNSHKSKKWNWNLGLRYDYNWLLAKKYYEINTWNNKGYSVDFSHFIQFQTGNQYYTEPKFEFHTIASQAGIGLKLNHHSHIHLQFGLNNRIPNASEFFSEGLHHSAAIIEIGDLRLKKETSYKFNLNYNYTSKFFKFEIMPFYNQINNYIISVPTGAVSTIRGAFPTYEYQQKNAVLLGVDYQHQIYILPELELQSNLSYLQGKNREDDDYLPLIPPFQWRNSLSYVWKEFKISINHHYVAQQQHFPNYNFPITFIENNVNVTQIVDVSTPPKAYQLFGLTIDYSVNIHKNQLKLSIFSQNIFDVKYRDYLNRMRYYADELGRNIGISAQYSF